MNIVYHFRVRGAGAEGVHIAGIVNALRQIGHDVAMVSPVNADPTASDPVASPGRYSSLLRFLADYAPQWFFELMEILYNIPAACKLHRAASRHEADLIYERYAFFNLAGVFTARRRNLPLILEVNELSGLERVRPQCFVKLAQWFEKKLLPRASLIVTVSPLLARRAGEIAGPGHEIMVVPNGVDREWVNAVTPETRRRELRRELRLTDAPVLGFVGGLVHWHLLDAVLGIIAEAPSFKPEPQLVLVGDGPLRDMLERRARRLGIAQSLRITGTMPHAAVREYLDIFDIALIPHANEYRSPIKLFEYMGAGCAVLAPRTEPIAAVVEDGKDGRLFEPLNFPQMREIMLELLADPARRRELGGHARRKIEDSFLWEHHAARILLNIHKIKSDFMHS